MWNGGIWVVVIIISSGLVDFFIGAVSETAAELLGTQSERSRIWEIDKWFENGVLRGEQS